MWNSNMIIDFEVQTLYRFGKTIFQPEMRKRIFQPGYSCASSTHFVLSSAREQCSLRPRSSFKHELTASKYSSEVVIGTAMCSCEPTFTAEATAGTNAATFIMAKFILWIQNFAECRHKTRLCVGAFANNEWLHNSNECFHFHTASLRTLTPTKLNNNNACNMTDDGFGLYVQMISNRLLTVNEFDSINRCYLLTNQIY